MGPPLATWFRSAPRLPCKGCWEAGWRFGDKVTTLKSSSRAAQQSRRSFMTGNTDDHNGSVGLNGNRKKKEGGMR